MTRWDHDPPSRLLFATDLVRVGAFRATPRNPLFVDSGPIPFPVFVFPRTFVRIQHAGKRSFVAGPNLITLYNRGQVYRREPVDPAGDFCEWFSVREDVLVDLLAARDPTVRDRPQAPFGEATSAPSDDLAYCRQRLLTEALAATPPAELEPLAVEEAVLAIAARVASLAVVRRARPDLGRRQRDCVERLEALLAERYAEDLSLADLAAEVGCSPFHLSRLFRQAQGTSVHRWRHGLRLRESLERLAAGEDDLSRLALELGFASHSHFTAAFRAAFGLPPSEVRRRATARRLASLRAMDRGRSASPRR